MSGNINSLTLLVAAVDSVARLSNHPDLSRGRCAGADKTPVLDTTRGTRNQNSLRSTSGRRSDT